MTTYSNLIAADPGFLAGFASILDIGDTLTEFNAMASSADADAAALRSDWISTGQTIRQACADFAWQHGLDE